MKTIYTFYADAARIALQSIFAHKLRAFLTLIGIIIGVASVVVVGAAISGLNTYVDDFGLVNTGELAGSVDSFTASIALVVVPITAISLLVGGGVMNIMLVSVTERTQEIGVRKAIGARRRDIVRQFLYEAMTLTAMGGVIGVLIAVGISKVIAFLLPTLPAEVPLWAVVSGLAVSVFVGLAFGVWPARARSPD